MSHVYKQLGKSIESHLRRYSTNPLTTPSYALAKRTSQNDPKLHTTEQLGLFYTIPQKTKDTLFKTGGFPKSFQANVATFGETCLMIRKPALEIINYINRSDLTRPAVRYVLYGKPGCGKSISLTHLLHYAFSNNYIILHVPWVWDWFRNVRHEVVYSSVYPGCVDLPVLSAQWLKHFQVQNEKIINEIDLPISKTYVWNQRENTPAGSHLKDLVLYGINRIKYAGDCVIAVISELKNLSNEKKCKTFVAIDGFNSLFGKATNLKTEDRTTVSPQMVTLTKAFLDASKQDWTNAVVVLTVDQMAANYKSLQSHLPLYLLGKSGFEHISPFIPVHVPEYTAMELDSALDYYEDRRWLQKLHGRHELSFLSNNNPYQLMNLCGPF